MWLNGLTFFIVSHHVLKFSGLWPCGSNNTEANIFYINLQVQPAEFGGHRHCYSGDIMILVCHVIHVIKGSCDVMGRSPSR